MRVWLAVLSLLLPVPALAQDLVVYADALQNGFSNYSYADPPASLPSFAQGTTVHAGAAAIAFTPQNYNAVALAHETMTFAPAQYSGVRLWVHGGTSGGQALQVNVYDTLLPVAHVAASAPLSNYISGGAIVANEWRQAEVRFADSPLSYSGSFVRFDIQDGGDGTAQPTLFLDDLALIETPSSPQIFFDGFEGAAMPPTGTLRFVSAAVPVGEAAGMLALMVERVGGSSGAASVQYASNDDSATQPGDYTQAQGQLSWDADEAGAKTVQVAIANDAVEEPGESFSVVLSDAQGAALGAPDTVVVTIADDDAPPPAACGLQIEQGVTVAQMVSDRFTWCDAAGKVRVAVLAHNDGQVGPGGARGGALREFRYRMPNDSERVANVTTYGNAGYGGFGYIVSHAKASGCVGDDSPLGYAYPGAFQRVFEGRHHAIFRFTQNYPRNCSTVNPMARQLPVTIDWVFATGRDHPLWAVTYDLQGFAANLFNDDSRAPYGELNIDGQGFTDIDGVAWGDRYRFTSTSAPVQLNSSWTWNVANTVPYVKLWLVAQDATMGLVQTQTMSQQDAGGGRNPGQFEYDVSDFWNTTSAQGNAGGAYAMPQQNEWPYQANAFSIGVGVSNNNARLTWGTQYGFLGQQTYAVNDGVVATAPGYPKKSYSVFVILGPHSVTPVEAQRTQIETVQSVTASAAIGTVDTMGAPGVNRAADAEVTLQPPGYDHVYAAWSFNATANALDANLAIAAGTLSRPLLIVRGYAAGALPATVRFNNVALVQDQDYFPSLRAAENELWITLDRDLAGPNNRIEVLP